jgi:hypothetical protein
MYGASSSTHARSHVLTLTTEVNTGAEGAAPPPLLRKAAIERLVAMEHSESDARALARALDRIVPTGDLYQEAHVQADRTLGWLVELQAQVANPSPSAEADMNHVRKLASLPPDKPLSQQIDIPLTVSTQAALDSIVTGYVDEQTLADACDTAFLSRHPVLTRTPEALHAASDQSVAELLACLRELAEPVQGLLADDVKAHYAPGGTLETYLKEQGGGPYGPALLGDVQKYLKLLHGLTPNSQAARERLAAALTIYPGDRDARNLDQKCAGGTQDSIQNAKDTLLKENFTLGAWVRERIAMHGITQRVSDTLHAYLPTALLRALGVADDIARSRNRDYKLGYDALAAHDVYNAAIAMVKAVHKENCQKLDKAYAGLSEQLDLYAESEDFQTYNRLQGAPLMKDVDAHNCLAPGREAGYVIDTGKIKQEVRRLQQLAPQAATTETGSPQAATLPFETALTSEGQAQLCELLLKAPPDGNALMLVWSLGAFPPEGHLAFLDIVDKLMARLPDQEKTIQALTNRLARRFPEPYQRERISQIAQNYQTISATPGIADLRRCVAPLAEGGASTLPITSEDVTHLVERQITLEQWTNLLAKPRQGNTFNISFAGMLRLLDHPQFEAISALLRDNNVRISCVESDPLNQFAGTSIAHTLARCGNANGIKRYAALGGNANSRNELLCNPVFIASVRGHTDAIQALVDAGADINMTNRTGRTPLIYAVTEGKATSCAKLLDCGADIEARYRGITSLHIASWSGNVAVLKILLGRQGININATNEQGWTPLHFAARFGHIAVIEHLAYLPGINLDAVNVDGWTPAHLAEFFGHDDLSKYLTTIKLSSRPK